MRRQNNTERARRAAEDLDTIREVYERGGGVSRSYRVNLSRAINKAADMAVVRLGRSYPEKYEQAERALKGTSYYKARIEEVRFWCEEIRALWERPHDMTAEEFEGARGKPPKKATGKKAKTLTLELTRDVPHVGFVRDEKVSVTETDALKFWDIGVARRRGESAGIGRVVAVTPESITLRRVDGDEVYDRADLELLGVASPEPVGKLDGLTDEQRAQVVKARKALEALGGEDDQILRGTERYRLEKIIFDIEYPADDPDDWGAWEEKGGED
jgi:hypothetical protein